LPDEGESVGIAQQFSAIYKIEEREFFEGTPLVLPGESLRISAWIAI
jgi:hypothetical protein